MEPKDIEGRSGATGERPDGQPGTDAEGIPPSVAEAFSAVVARWRDGDLTARLSEDWDDEPTASLAADLNGFVADVAGTMTEMDGFGDEVAGATEHVGSNVEEAKGRSDEVYAAVDEIADAAADQHDRIDEAVSELQTISATTEEVAASADQVATTAEAVEQRASEGSTAATAALDELEAVDDRTAGALDRVERLETEIERIEEVTDLIRDIADETNILALNASIEAARAGEAGAGFEVVANEVKNLAEEAQDATESIESSIDSVRDETDATVEEMAEMREQVDEGIATAEEALEAFSDLAADVEETTGGVKEISDATDDQAVAVEETVGSLEAVGDIAEDTAETAADVTTMAHTQRTSLTEVAASVAALEERTGTMDAHLESYELSGTADDDAVVLEFWHALGGEKARLLEELADEFESLVDGVAVRPSSKGSYRGTFEATLAAAERGDPPAISHIYEIGTRRALDSDAFVPVERLLDEDYLATDDLLDPVVDYYAADGELYSLPFNSSTPVLYYNRAAFERAGLDPDDPPTTFAEVRHCAERLVESGAADTGITFANYSWFIEQWFAEAGQPLVDGRNGRERTPTEAHFDGEVGRTVYEWISGLESDSLYHNPGIEARGRARELFRDGTAGMLIGSTSSMAAVHHEAGFPVGTGYFPVADERHGVVVGGGALWIADGVSRAQQRAAATFLGWLAQPAQQARWHRQTGYFPVHAGALDRLSREGWFDENPGYRTAIDQLLDAESTPATTGARIGPFNTVRTLVAEGYEDVREHGVEEGLSRLNDAVEMQLRTAADR